MLDYGSVGLEEEKDTDVVSEMSVEPYLDSTGMVKEEMKENLEGNHECCVSLF